MKTSKSFQFKSKSSKNGLVWTWVKIWTWVLQAQHTCFLGFVVLVLSFFSYYICNKSHLCLHFFTRYYKCTVMQMWRPFYLVIPTNNLATKWNAILCSNHVTFKTILQNYCHAVLFTCSSMSEVCKQQLIQVVWFVKWKHKHAAKENQVVWQIHMSVLFYSRYSRTSQFSWSCIHWRTCSLILTTISLVQSGYLSLTFPFTANNCCHSLCHNKRNFIAF